MCSNSCRRRRFQLLKYSRNEVKFTAGVLTQRGKGLTSEQGTKHGAARVADNSLINLLPALRMIPAHENLKLKQLLAELVLEALWRFLDICGFFWFGRGPASGLIPSSTAAELGIERRIGE
ncbi:hypothetical protein Y1Q_0008931 [Alligator mississippiensis]|uniref:Uncharacterized protein n=1 Tax=Alligator mississippiensis TaxID=8496 RepID=A0A151NKM2_ALLMI|nr:hypothetical protein Y1Q_0008931 [Alligator mississippiensis]